MIRKLIMKLLQQKGPVNPRSAELERLYIQEQQYKMEIRLKAVLLELGVYAHQYPPRVGDH